MQKDIFKICPDCAYSTQDGEFVKCPNCKTELLRNCPLCLHPFMEMRSICCSKCGEKLRVSYVPIQ